MKKGILVGVLLAMAFWGQSQEEKWEGNPVDFSHGKLAVSGNKRFLIFEDGTPFFWLGDTAWELFHRLTRDETEKYLENRREKGFTVIQAVILAELDGLNTANAEGEKPLIGNDPARINEKYFEHVDWVIKKAAEKGMFIGLLPTWGDKVDKQWGIGPAIFNVENARAYGEIIGTRYKDYPNIIWIIGGDRSGGGDNFPVWNALARGIKRRDPNHLMTFHPVGGHSSSEWFHEQDWLDFNMMQTGHGERSYAACIRMLKPDYDRKPTKPVLDGEPRYEDHPCNWQPEILGWFNDADVRQAAYWDLFTGAFGHTYGCHAIWQMLAPGSNPVGHARNTWYDDLDLPGAWDMLYVRRLMESRPFLDRVPFPQIIQNKYFPETDYVVATAGDNYVMVYFPTGWEAELDLHLCAWPKIHGWWYNCQNGKATDLGIMDGTQMKSFSPQTHGRGNDWVLVPDNAEAGFDVPGKP